MVPIIFLFLFILSQHSFATCDDLKVSTISKIDCEKILKSDESENLSKFLNNSFFIEFNLSGDIQVSEKRLHYLMNDLPLATMIINHYRKTPYIFEYTNVQKTKFNIAKGEQMKGSASIVLGGTSNQPIYYFGEGVVRTGPITVRGPALVKFQSIQSGRETKYSMSVIITLNNGVSYFFMNSGVIRSIIQKKIDNVLLDVLTSAKLFSENPQIPQGWNEYDKNKLKELLRIP